MFFYLGVIGEELVDFLGCINQQKHDTGLFDLGKGTFDTHVFHFIVGVADTCRVDEAEGNPLEVYGILDHVAGGSLDIGNDGPVFFQEGIQQGAFSHVGIPDDSHGDTVLDDVAEREGITQARNQRVDSHGDRM